MNRREMFLLKTWHASALNKLYENVSDVNLHIVKKREIDLFHFLPFLHFEMWLKRQACQVKIFWAGQSIPIKQGLVVPTDI